MRNRVEPWLERYAAMLDSARPLSLRQGDSLPGWDVVHVAPAGSLGDDALARGVLGAARIADTDVRFLVPGDANLWEAAGISPAESLDSLMNQYTMHRTRQSQSRFIRADLACIGADTISGEYGVRFLGFRVRLLNGTAKAGRRARIINASFSAHPTPEAVRILRHLDSRVEVHARDRNSQQRLANVLGREIGLAPDVAVLVEPEHTERSRSSGAEPSVVLVPNAHMLTHFGAERAQLVSMWAEVGMAMARDRRVIVMPHDVRKMPDDPGLSNDVVAEIRRKGSAAEIFIPRTAGEAKSLVSHSDLVISARMHACVAGLSMGIPTVGLEYVGKFVGQFAWFGDLGTVLSGADASSSEAVIRAAEEALGKKADDDTIRQVKSIVASILG